MRKAEAVKQFFDIPIRYKDYYEMQEAWSCFTDYLLSGNLITGRQFRTWGNPCTPETFSECIKRWERKE